LWADPGEFLAAAGDYLAADRRHVALTGFSASGHKVRMIVRIIG
jgi:hypothetical protein